LLRDPSPPYSDTCSQLVSLPDPVLANPAKTGAGIRDPERGAESPDLEDVVNSNVPELWSSNIPEGTPAKILALIVLL